MTKEAAPTPVFPSQETTDSRMRVTVGKILIPTLIASALFLISMVAWILVISSSPNGDLMTQIFAIKVVQTISALVLGFICVCLGFVMSWFGITGAFSVNAENAGGKLKIEATHIGLILLIGGMLLMGIGLTTSLNDAYGGPIESTRISASPE